MKTKLLFGILIVSLSMNAYSADDNLKEDTRDFEISWAPSDEEDDVVYPFVERMPQFPGGDAAMRDFIRKELKYPVLLSESAPQGRVYCCFIVEKDGTISNIEVIKGVDPLLDKEAVRVIMLMPKWIPGNNNGSRVRVRYLIAVTFKLPQNP